MKIYVNRAPVSGPWGGGNQWVRAFHEFVPELKHDVVQPDDAVTAPDVIVLAGLDDGGQGISADKAVMYKEMMRFRHDVRLVLRVNENDARKGTTTVDRNLIMLSKYLDGTVFTSDWIRDYFLTKGWQCPNNTVIKNGVQGTVFKPGIKLNNGKVNVVAHHWSNNEMKGFDIYEELDRFVGKNTDFTFAYIGRDRGTFKNTNVIRPLTGKKLGDALGRYDVYVSASRFEPGPNHVIESIACGLPTFVHHDGGGSVEFAGQEAVYNTWEELKQRLMTHNWPTNHVQFTDWRTCITSFVSFLETTCLNQIT